MEKKDLWLNKLKERLSDYSEPIPVSGWEQLESKLMSPKGKRIVLYRKWISVAAAVILLAVISAGMYFLSVPTTNNEIYYTSAPDWVALPDDLPEVWHPVEQDRLAQAGRNISAIGVSATHKGEETLPVSDETEQVVETEDMEKAEVSDETIKDNKPSDIGMTENKSRDHRSSGRDRRRIPIEKPVVKKEKGNWSMGLSVGNSNASSDHVETNAGGYSNVRTNLLYATSGLIEVDNDQALVIEDGVAYLSQINISKINHHQPVSVGVSVRKDLKKGFSVESGLVYTLLSSDVELSDNREVDQKLHYIGLPVRANWNFLNAKLVTLYVAGGGMMEKCVYGKIGSDKETEKPLQFSVSGAVGAQLNATKHMGVYIEPGVAYFFDNGSDVQTIRKDNPVNFNIQAGVRFTY